MSEIEQDELRARRAFHDNDLIERVEALEEAGGGGELTAATLAVTEDALPTDSAEIARIRGLRLDVLVENAGLADANETYTPAGVQNGHTNRIAPNNNSLTHNGSGWDLYSENMGDIAYTGTDADEPFDAVWSTVPGVGVDPPPDVTKLPTAVNAEFSALKTIIKDFVLSGNNELVGAKGVYTIFPNAPVVQNLVSVPAGKMFIPTTFVAFSSDTDLSAITGDLLGGFNGGVDEFVLMPAATLATLTDEDRFAIHNITGGKAGTPGTLLRANFVDRSITGEIYCWVFGVFFDEISG